MRKTFLVIIMASIALSPIAISANVKEKGREKAARLETVLLYDKSALPYIRKQLDGRSWCALNSNQAIAALGLDKVAILVLMDPEGFTVEERCPGGPAVIPMDKTNFTITILAIEFQRRESGAKNRP